MDFDFPETKVIGAGAAAIHILEFKGTLDRKSLNINRDERTVDNVILAQVGEAKGHEVEIEQSFIDDMASYVERKMGGRVQCNMGHRWDALGFQFGRFINLRAQGKKFVGKLMVYKAADKSPEMSGMADWFFDLAEEDPKAVMCSIRFVPKHYYQYDDKGQKVIIQYAWWSGPIKAYENKPAYVAFERLISCDIVDNGALTESLFAEPTASRMFIDFIQSPGFVEFLEENHEHLPTLTEWYRQKFEVSISKYIANLFSKKSKVDPKNDTSKTTPDTPDTVDNKEQNAPETTTDLQAKIDAATKPLQDKISGYEEKLQSLTTELAELKKKPAADITSLKTDDPDKVDLGKGSEDEPWMSSPINKQAAKFAAKRQASTTTQ